MKALRYHEFGGPEVMKIEEIPVPEPGEGEVLVKVSGSGINPVDWKVRSGMAKQVFPVELPQIVGWEFSGTVEKLGPGVSGFEVGNEVYGHSHWGTTAEYTIAKVGEMALKPVSMDLPDAASVPLAGSTAWQALFDHGGLEAGQRVLIHAASGGVGTFAVQLAKWKGAYVIGTASEKNHHLLRELGADELIDYHKTPFETAVKDVDVVLQAVGGDENMAKSLSVLKPGGILVSITSAPPEEEAKKQGKRAAHFSMKPNASQLTEMAGLIQDLKVRPVIDTVVPLREAVEAHRESQDGHVVGKIVVDVRR